MPTPCWIQTSRPAVSTNTAVAPGLVPGAHGRDPVAMLFCLWIPAGRECECLVGQPVRGGGIVSRQRVPGRQSGNGHDRTSVGSGQSGAVRVGLGGARSIKETNII